MAVYALANPRYSFREEKQQGSTLPIFYYIRLPAIQFQLNSLVRTARITFTPATNDCKIKLVAFWNSFLFQKTLEKQFTLNESLSRFEFSLNIVCLDLLVDLYFEFNQQVPIPDESQDILQPQQNNIGLFNLIGFEVFYEPAMVL